MPYALSDAAKDAAATFKVCKDEDGKWKLQTGPSGTDAEMYDGSFPDVYENLRSIALDNKLVSLMS